MCQPVVRRGRAQPAPADGHSSRGEVVASALACDADVAGVNLGGEAQRVDALVQVVGVGRDVDEHQRLAVSTQAVLEQERQLAVPVRNVRVLVGQGGDDVAEAGEALVDVLGLLEPVASALALLETLAASEVNEVEDSLGHLAGDLVLAGDLELEDAVAARGTVVALRLGDGPVLGGRVEEAVHLVGPCDGHVGEVGHRRRLGLRVLDAEVLGVRVTRLGEEVADRLVVDLEVVCEELVRPTPAAQCLCSLEDLVHCARDHAPRLLGGLLGALHGVGLARARLAVGEYADVVAVQCALHEGRDLLEHLALRAVRREDVVELEIVRLTVPRVADCARARRQRHSDVPLLPRRVRERVAVGAALLAGQHRPHPAEDADVALQLENRVVQLASLHLVRSAPLLQVLDRATKLLHSSLEALDVGLALLRELVGVVQLSLGEFELRLKASDLEGLLCVLALHAGEVLAHLAELDLDVVVLDLQEAAALLLRGELLLVVLLHGVHHLHELLARSLGLVDLGLVDGNVALEALLGTGQVADNLRLLCQLLAERLHRLLRNHNPVLHHALRALQVLEAAFQVPCGPLGRALLHWPSVGSPRRRSLASGRPGSGRGAGPRSAGGGRACTALGSPRVRSARSAGPHTLGASSGRGGALVGRVLLGRSGRLRGPREARERRGCHLPARGRGCGSSPG
mmetsp:Transcript_15755/g.61539  ORF Transcript_15755/g.61539 Transcript_15755/m.61539 type:complete len:686 (-) Transcript_15755:107-2164(-)